MRWSSTGRTIDDALASMRYWDASAIIPLLADEPSRERLLAYLEQDAEILAWWGTPVEIASAIARREREQLLTPEQAESVLASAHQLAEAWHEIGCCACTHCGRPIACSSPRHWWPATATLQHSSSSAWTGGLPA
jgi:hypothetical protein